MTLRVAAILLCTLAAVSAAQSPAGLRLVRCMAGSDVPCVAARVPMDAGARRVLGRIDSSAERRSWSATLGGSALTGAGFDNGPMVRARLLVLIDGGSAMAGDRFAFSRIALRSWLATLDTSNVRVAVAAFTDTDVTPDIASARFETPARAAIALEQFDAPTPVTRSPLASAVALGAKRVAASFEAEPGTVGGLIVISSGRNDPPRGRDSVQVGAVGADVRIWLLVLGTQGAAADLDSLLPANAELRRVPINPNAVTSRLGAISRELTSERVFTFGTGMVGGAALGRSLLRGRVALHAGASTELATTLAWRPPLVALPVFTGVASPASLSPALRESMLLGAPAGNDHALVALLMALVVGCSWALATRYTRVEPVTAAPAAKEHATTSRTAAASMSESEGLPRRPEEVTHQTARRTALRR